MKKLYLFLICFLPVGEAFSHYEEVSPNILRELIEETSEEIEKKDHDKFPKIKGRLVFDINSTDEYQTTDKSKEIVDTYAKARLYSSIELMRHLSVNSYVRLGHVNRESDNQDYSEFPSHGKNRNFKDEGAWIEELNLTYDTKKYAIVMGKFDLNFGSAWRWNRGIWAYQLAQNYKEMEKLGFNGIYRVGDAKKNGRYEFSYAMFTNDRKNLDNSLITNRYSDSKYDAIPGDTRSLSSYIGSLDINFDFSEKEKLSYHFSYVNLAVNKRASSLSGKIDNQKGTAVGMNYKYPLNDAVILDAMVEYANIKNLGGNSAVKENYFTGNLITKIFDNWNVTTGFARQNNTNFDRNLAEISFGYEFVGNKIFDSLLLQFGYKNQRDNLSSGLEVRNSVGALLRYQKHF